MRSVRRTAAGIFGAAATLLLHALFFTVAMWGGGGPQRVPVKPPDALGAAANTGRADGESGESRLIVRLNMAPDAQQLPAELAPRLSEEDIRQAMLEVTGPDALPMPPLRFEQEGEATESTDAEMLARTRLAGIYESQIRARIERVWTLPQQAQGPSFSCRVEIRQRLDGRIAEVAVDLEQCEGTADWQQSLVSAIYTASPLPAPPHPSVFVDRFSLVFRASAMASRPR